MSRFPRPDPRHRGVLLRVLEACRRPGAVCVFDLDSTLFDNRPRQARILREYGAVHGLSALARTGPEHFESGWDLRLAMVAVGVPASEAETLYERVKTFWRDRFFTSPYCLDDVPIEGAPAFVRAVHEAGAMVAYCTGRHEPMREGSEGSLRAHGFPIPGRERVQLIMKPTFEVTDDDFKRFAHEKLRGLGQVVAAFDNEPIHINDYHRVFPEALSVHLATDHSGRDVPVAPGLPAVADFVLP